MQTQVHVVGFGKDIGIERRHFGEPSALKFVVIDERGVLHVVMGVTSQHRALALIHLHDYQLGPIRAFYNADHATYPPELFRLPFLGAGRIHAFHARGVHVPRNDSVVDWRSVSLNVETDRSLRPMLSPVLLAHVSAALAAHDAVNPPPPPSDHDF